MRRFGLMLFLFVEIATAWPQGVAELVGHQKSVSAVGYLADGQTLVSASFDGTVRLWNVAEKKEVRLLSAHGDMVLALGIRPDARQLLSAGRETTAKLWNIGAVEPKHSIGPIPGGLIDLASTPDPNQILTTSGDGFVRFYSVDSAALASEFKAHEGAIRSAQWSADGASLFTGGDDGSVAGWKGSTGRIATGGPVHRLAILRDGSAVVTSDASGNRTAWNLPFQAKRPLPNVSADIVRLLASNTRVVALGADNIVRVYDRASGNEERAIAPPAPIKDWALHPADADILLLAGEDKSLRAYRVSDGALLSAKEELPDVPRAVVFGPMGQSVYWGDGRGAILRVPYPFTVEFDDRPLDYHAGPVTSISRSASSGLSLSASADKTVLLRDAANNPVRAFALLASVRQAVLSPTDDRVAAIGTDQVLRLWLANGAEQKVIPGVVGGIAFSLDGKWLAYGGPENKAYVLPTDLSAEPRAVLTHGGVVEGVAFSTSHAQLISAGADGVIKYGDLATGAEIRAFAGHQGPVHAVALSPDGKRLASAGEDKTARIWNLETGELVATLSESAAPLTQVAWSADGTALASASADGRARIYRDGKFRAEVAGTAPLALAFGPTAKELLVGQADHKIHVLREREPATFAQHSAAIADLALTPDGSQLLSAAGDKLVRSWEIATASGTRAWAHSAEVTHLSLLADGTRFLSAEAGGKVRLFDLASAEPVALVEGASAPVQIRTSVAGDGFIVLSADGTVRHLTRDGAIHQQETLAGGTDLLPLDAAGARVVAAKEKQLYLEPPARRWQAPGPALPIALYGTAAGLVTLFPDGTMELRDSAGQVVRSVVVGPILAAALSADETTLFLAGADQKIRLVSIGEGKVLSESPPAAGPIASVARSADGMMLATSLGDGSTVLWSLAGGSPVPTRTIPAQPAPNKVAFVGQHVVVATPDHTIKVFDPPPPPFLDLAGHGGAVYSASFSRDGALAATAGLDEVIRLWSTTDGAKQAEWRGHKGTVYTVAFSADGTKMISAGADKEIVVWERATGKELRRLAGSSEQLYQVAFLPDDKQVIGAGVDRVVRVWDLETGNVVQSLEGHSDEVYGLSVRADGARLVTAGNSGQVIVWDRASGQKLFETKLAGEAYAVAYRPDGVQIAVASANGKIYLIDLPENAR